MRMQNRRRSLWLCLGIVALIVPPGGGALANGTSASWPAVLFSTRTALPVASGLEYRHVTLTTEEGPLEVHQLQVDLHNPTLRLGVALAHDRLVSKDETVSSMTQRSGAIAGINGDYFDIHESGIPLNIVVRDGQLIRSPWRWVALALGKDGSTRIVRYKWTGSVVLLETGEKHALDGYNTGLSPDGIVAISEIMAYGAPAPDPGTRQTVFELLPGAEAGRYYLKEVWAERPFYAPIPKDEIILVGRGEGADWLLARATAGAPIQLNLTTDPDWHDLQSAIGGGPVLIENGQIVEDLNAPAAQERDQRNPVIAVGIGQDGRTLTFVEVDGRQPTLSIGLTRPQLAAYMQRLGASQAMAFDSGGSATMVVRLPGHPVPTVVNSPSDGTERPVANALLVYSIAVPGPPSRLIINANQPLRLFASARASLPPVIGVDAQGTPAPLPDPVLFVAPSRLLTVGGDGTVVAGPTPGIGVLRAQSGAASGTLPVSVTTRLSKLLVVPDTVNVAPGAGWTFQLRGLDSAGWPVVLPEGAVAWAVKPPWLGTVLPSGTFTAADVRGDGIITARLGGVAAWARIAVGNVTRYVSDFDQGEWEFRSTPETVTGSVGPATTPSHLGRPSVQLAFNLDGVGTRAAYLMTHLAIPGSPTGVTLWAYGDGSGVWLRGTYVQASGDPGTVTLARHVDWRGWRSVTGVLPSSLSYPITWTSLYVVETDPARSPHGVIYLSNFRAVYPAGPR